MARHLGFSFANTGACAQAQVHHSLLPSGGLSWLRLRALAESCTKAIALSPQVTQFFNIGGFLEILRSFYGIFRLETGDF